MGTKSLDSKVQNYRDFFYTKIPYKVRKAKYTWITKIVNILDDPNSIDNWIKEVGEDEAEMVRESSIEFRNDAVKKVFEITRNGMIISPSRSYYEPTYNQLPRILDQVGHVYSTKVPMVSYKHKWQGTAEVLAEIKRKPTLLKVLAFLKYKDKFLDKYFVELAAYVYGFNKWAKYEAIKQGAALYMDVEGNVDLMLVSLEDLKPYYDEFQYRLGIFNVVNNKG